MTLATTPEPPYVAVIFTSVRTEGDNGYAVMSDRMSTLVEQQPGFLGVDSAHEDIGITVSYWTDEQSAAAWKRVAEHTIAQDRGKSVWYGEYQVRVATVTRAYEGP
jgi:heme-degrading monooxygenase HmoA